MYPLTQEQEDEVLNNLSSQNEEVEKVILTLELLEEDKKEIARLKSLEDNSVMFRSLEWKYLRASAKLLSRYPESDLASHNQLVKDVMIRYDLVDFLKVDILQSYLKRIENNHDKYKQYLLSLYALLEIEAGQELQYFMERIYELRDAHAVFNTDRSYFVDILNDNVWLRILLVQTFLLDMNCIDKIEALMITNGPKE
jgi:hypothetical protein|nr:MAG TPA: hypothetical protein [Bacteriophage sp.]